MQAWGEGGSGDGGQARLVTLLPEVQTLKGAGDLRDLGVTNHLRSTCSLGPPHTQPPHPAHWDPPHTASSCGLTMRAPMSSTVCRCCRIIRHRCLERLALTRCRLKAWILYTAMCLHQGLTGRSQGAHRALPRQGHVGRHAGGHAGRHAGEHAGRHAERHVRGYLRRY